MSEYQFHEWQAVDRVLTPDDEAADMVVTGLITRVEFTAAIARAAVWMC